MLGLSLVFSIVFEVGQALTSTETPQRGIKLKRIATALLFLLAAIACYAFGVPAGGVIFLALGIIFEGIFWIKLFKRKKKPT
ncbi:hypothetical protein BTJ40_12430 [Microbulbifer sp. A4B17]|uniref:hypothetical protein n=1 Tax=Microbulbifer sp. A4B17 TaxID=359370 RepID=UPI000D52B01B|nr:hypothetical protein [Microbulbifer sp. A4B17]AWF81565.1 hypothetical protein BTJ40_12430 [Microbulbifer sp. A4B17]